MAEILTSDKTDGEEEYEVETAVKTWVDAQVDAEVARKADTIMQQADKDGDGVVTFDEFVIVSKKFPNILFPAYSSSK